MRSAVRAEHHPDLTLTALYNATAERQPHPDVVRRGRVLVLRELHAQLDAPVDEAYGWPPELSSPERIERLLELNLLRTRRSRWAKSSGCAPDTSVRCMDGRR